MPDESPVFIDFAEVINQVQRYLDELKQQGHLDQNALDWHSDRTPPIISELDQPDDFAEALDDVQFELGRLGLTWHSDRIQLFVVAMHGIAGWCPPNLPTAICGLSYKQLLTLKTKLQDEKKQQLSLSQHTPTLGVANHQRV